MKTFDQIKTFEDACKVERLNPTKVLPDFKAFPAGDRKAMIAHAKLVIIAKAANRLANDGKIYKPDWNNDDEYKYYPWFEMGGSSGFRCGDFGHWLSFSDVGSRLCFKSSEVATHIGKQFEALYKQYFVI
jgi:hypothetical protein